MEKTSNLRVATLNPKHGGINFSILNNAIEVCKNMKDYMVSLHDPYRLHSKIENISQKVI